MPTNTDLSRVLTAIKRHHVITRNLSDKYKFAIDIANEAGDTIADYISECAVEDMRLYNEVKDLVSLEDFNG